MGVSCELRSPWRPEGRRYEPRLGSVGRHRDAGAPRWISPNTERRTQNAERRRRSALGRRAGGQLLVDDLLELLERLCPVDHAPVDEEGRGAADARFLAGLDVLVDGVLELLRRHALLELLLVDADLAGHRLQIRRGQIRRRHHLLMVLPELALLRAPWRGPR